MIKGIRNKWGQSPLKASINFFKESVVFADTVLGFGGN
jgi:hypothetical protein